MDFDSEFEYGDQVCAVKSGVVHLLLHSCVVPDHPLPTLDLSPSQPGCDS